MSFYMLSCMYVAHTGLSEAKWEAWLVKWVAFTLMHYGGMRFGIMYQMVCDHLPNILTPRTKAMIIYARSLNGYYVWVDETDGGRASCKATRRMEK